MRQKKIFIWNKQSHILYIVSLHLWLNFNEKCPISFYYIKNLSEIKNNQLYDISISLFTFFTSFPFTIDQI